MWHLYLILRFSFFERMRFVQDTSATPFGIADVFFLHAPAMSFIHDLANRI